jgi:hypothetical protein
MQITALRMELGIDLDGLLTPPTSVPFMAGLTVGGPATPTAPAACEASA